MIEPIILQAVDMSIMYYTEFEMLRKKVACEQIFLRTC